jgi:ferrochelatase
MTKTAVVLLNLGGPDSPEAVKPFLYNLFKDPAIFRLPKIFRLPLAKFVSSRRTQKAQGIYAHMGGKSPILELTREQASALELALNENKKADEHKVFICMRYWHPMSEHTVLQVKYWKPDRVILLPLYPQFSTTTTASSIQDWQDRSKIEALDVPIHSVCCYPMQKGFITAHAEKIKQMIQQASTHGKPRILFSAHGLPEKVIKDGDPYQWQVEQTTKAVIEAMGIADLDYTICYQSRVGPLKWIGPNTEGEIIKAAKENTPIVVVPIAFVSEHSETLVELDIEYKELFEMNGGHHYYRVSALGTDTHYIEALKAMCMEAVQKATFKNSVAPDTQTRICPNNWKECPCGK